MDRADIPIEVALSIVLAAAVDGADRRSLLTALGGPRPALEALPRPRTADDDADPEGGTPAGGSPALVFAFPTPGEDDHDPDGPAAA